MTNKCAGERQNGGFNQVSEETKSQVAAGKITDIPWFEPNLGDEVVVPSDGIDQGRGEVVGSGEWGGRRVSVFSNNPGTNGSHR